MRTTILLTAALAATASDATAQLRVSGQDIRTLESRQIDPRAASRIRALSGHLAKLPDGSYISTINGRRTAIGARSGATLIIEGRGFDQRRAMSLAGIFAPGQTTGALLTIVSWTDTHVVATVPTANSHLAADTDMARLSLQIVRANGLQQSLEVTGIRFRAR